MLNSVCKAGSYCGALVGPQWFSMRSQGSLALAVRVQRYAVDAFCSQFARRLKKWSRLAACKTLAIKQRVRASLNTHKFPRELYHTALDHSQVRPLLAQEAHLTHWLSAPSALAKLFQQARLPLTRHLSARSRASGCPASAPPGLPASPSPRVAAAHTARRRAAPAAPPQDTTPRTSARPY